MTVVTDYTVLLKNAHETELPDIITDTTWFIAIRKKIKFPGIFLVCFLHIFPDLLTSVDFAKQKFNKLIQ